MPMIEVSYGMADVEITRKGFKCLRCGYEWIPRKQGHAPQLCPKCRSAYWNKPRVRRRRTKAKDPRTPR